MGIRGIEALTENKCDHNWITNNEETFRRCLGCDTSQVKATHEWVDAGNYDWSSGA